MQTKQTDWPTTPEEWRARRIARGWHAAHDGTSKYSWFVTRETWGEREYVERADGRLSWFASYEAAQARADRLNQA